MHLDFDSAWPAELGDLPRLNLTAWGPRLRFITRPVDIEKLARNVLRTLEDSSMRFVVYGSGDFHHLSALWLRRFVQEPLELISFDNHPDWDIRPPRWGCGAWLNRALEFSPNLRRASVWGLGNFEYWWPGRLFAPRGHLASGRLEVHPWSRPGLFQRRLRSAAMQPETWPARFEAFARELRDRRVYVTIDLDCLTTEDAVTNWEQGRFRRADLVWALATLRAAGANVVGGDLCGAWSEPRYARRFQRFAARMDHPNLPPMDLAQARDVNVRAFAELWPALTGA
ncbi:MAG: hypothetical protein JSR82_23355 [Verrucomicrobia bacterium]|nr:hypothetical protein [Verrucomicrobiota bacterium]